MPSDSFLAFKNNLVDVDRLIADHAKLHNGSPGKKGLGHITRSGVVMLCAAWELYAESVLVEALEYLAEKCQSPDALPLEVRKELAKHVKNAKNELRPLALANDGWRDVLIAHSKQWCAALNTPKAGPLDDLFKKFLGVPSLSSSWTCGAVTLNAFVGVRGDIAHRGRHANYVKLDGLKNYRGLIAASAVETDNAVSAHLVAIAPGGKKPWKATT